ncbi:Tyrosine--tRNA ligase [Alphaproteobacteria bacterium]
MHDSDLLRELAERGYVYQCTDVGKLGQLLEEECVVGYVGFDCTAKSLHVGNLMQIMIMRVLQKHGHKPLVLLGGATTGIGDPSGRDETRQMLTLEDIERNKQSILSNIQKFLDFTPLIDNSATIVDNTDWLAEIKYLEFLENYGRCFSVNRMLGFDSVRLRLEREQALTFLEFNYMLLQAYDFVELYRRYGCKLQFGGSEQWGNIVSGIDLARKIEGAELFGITTPLITTSSGAKMGKSVKGAVWLNNEMLSPYEYWQFWRNTDDADVIRFLKLYTDLPISEIERLAKLEGQEVNEAKIVLADEATALCHGEAAAVSARQTAQQVFYDGTIEGADLPRYNVSREALDSGIPLYKLLVLSRLSISGNEAKKLIQSDGVRVNNQILTNDVSIIINKQHLSENYMIKLSVGKKRHALIVVD